MHVQRRCGERFLGGRLRRRVFGSPAEPLLSAGVDPIVS
jgi:hypothetical protein